MEIPKSCYDTPTQKQDISTMNKAIIAIIGSGNMGASLIGGLIADGYPASNIWITDPAVDRLKQIEHQFGVNGTTDNHKAVKHADVVIFAVKPQIFAPVAKDLAASIQQKKPLVMSVAAGIRETTLQQWLGGNLAIVRSMPNTPALIGCGAAALYANQHVSAPQRDIAESILRAVGLVVWLEDEKLMDAVTALSGSGPAYFFMVMEVLQQAAEDLGLPKEIARLLTLQTGFGAARMALESETSVGELRKQVTSPGGTTEAALNVLEQENLRHIFAKALNAAAARSEELANRSEKMES
jgi:pyrroline-5-carboxylate reductase